MVLRYDPGDSLAHALDPRAKLAVQFAFAASAFAHTTVAGLVVLTAVTGIVLYGARTSPVSTLRELWVLLPVLVVGPLLQGLTLSAPYFSVAEARFPALAAYRTLLVLLVAAAYVRTTPVRDSRAAVQRTIPGKSGQFLGTGVAFVFRFLPVLRRDLSRIRDASRARLGDRRRLDERMRLVALGGLNRAFSRADSFALALRARCFAWNPTLPALSFSRADLPALALAAALALSVVL
ncbi:cobalt ABC transporter permease [Halobacteriales archaeon QS_5_70_15]|nr:MAG: cobalt ABC transporter permease [Halobacteriales archaeon QS_5_70_15]